MSGNLRPPHVVVVGSCMTDLVVRAERLPKAGETVVGSEFFQGSGGKGANQAVAAARLGGRVSLHARVGGDAFGEAQLAGLQAAGVDTAGVAVDPKRPTGVATITLDAEGQNRIIIVPGANWHWPQSQRDRLKAAVAEADLVMLQMEIPLDVNLLVVEEAARCKKRVIYNPAPAAPLPPHALRRIWLLTPNESEAETLTGVAIESVDDARKAAARLIELGVRHVVVTLGAQGSFYLGEDGEHYAPAWPVQVVDTTAAGDAFHGGLAIALTEGWPWERSLPFANAAGALAASRKGAQSSMPSRSELEVFLKARTGEASPSS